MVLLTEEGAFKHKFLNFGPSNHTKFLGLTLDTWDKVIMVYIVGFMSTFLTAYYNTVAHNFIHGFIWNPAYTKKIQMSKIYTALGTMCGTSLDGIDLSIIRTDGEDHLSLSKNDYLDYIDTVFVEEGKVLEVQYDLIPNLGYLQVNTIPINADIFSGQFDSRKDESCSLFSFKLTGTVGTSLSFRTGFLTSGFKSDLPAPVGSTVSSLSRFLGSAIYYT